LSLWRNVAFPPEDDAPPPENIVVKTSDVMHMTYIR
jgi:hypothetical protein